MMNARIRKAQRSDVPAMLSLIKELATFEREPAAVITTAESMERDGFSNEKIFDALVAEYENEIVGLAVFYTCYSTWKGKIVYLDDLIVTEKMRGKKIGKQLLNEVARIAKESGANQLRWHVLDWNETAIQFYKNYQAEFDEHWITCKLTKEQLENFSGS
jgi:GNAT superfamily N-acetyltransferase